MPRRFALLFACASSVTLAACAPSPSQAPTPTVVINAPLAVNQARPSPYSPVEGARVWAPMDAGRLDPDLADRWAKAQAAARKAGISLTLTSGYRSTSEQLAEWDAAVKRYGSETEAKHWVLTPYESAHVRGLAIDVGPTTVEMAWLEAHQEQFGLCRIYKNEPWHFEPLRGAHCAPLRDSATS